MEETLTHEELRKRAVRWLTNTAGCGVVLSETVTNCSEIPDAIGWQGHARSIAIECKVSRSDFHANKKKCHVRSNRGVGQKRYILCPKGMITADDLNNSDYGLLVIAGQTVRVLKEPTCRRSHCQQDEIIMLVSALRRVREREFLVIVREMEGAECIPIPAV